MLRAWLPPRKVKSQFPQKTFSAVLDVCTQHHNKKSHFRFQVSPDSTLSFLQVQSPLACCIRNLFTLTEEVNPPRSYIKQQRAPSSTTSPRCCLPGLENQHIIHIPDPEHTPQHPSPTLQPSAAQAAGLGQPLPPWGGCRSAASLLLNHSPAPQTQHSLGFAG